MSPHNLILWLNFLAPHFLSAENGAANDDDTSIPEKPCKTAGCDYPAADHNYNKCLVHRCLWIPTKHTSTDGCIRHDRGHMLLGPEFSIAQNPGAKAYCCYEM
jgi:hypothetical protein